MAKAHTLSTSVQMYVSMCVCAKDTRRGIDACGDHALFFGSRRKQECRRGSFALKAARMFIQGLPGNDRGGFPPQASTSPLAWRTAGNRRSRVILRAARRSVQRLRDSGHGGPCPTPSSHHFPRREITGIQILLDLVHAVAELSPCLAWVLTRELVVENSADVSDEGFVDVSV